MLSASYVRTRASKIAKITGSVSTCVMNGTTNPPAQRRSSPSTKPYSNVNPTPTIPRGNPRGNVKAHRRLIVVQVCAIIALGYCCVGPCQLG